MKLDKKLVENCIVTTKDMYYHGDYKKNDYADWKKAHEILLDSIQDNNNWLIVNLIEDLAYYSLNEGATNEQIYQALAVFGIEVVDE